MYQPGTKPRFTPKASVETVLDAVMHGIERENKRQQKVLLKEQLNIEGGKLNGSAITDHPVFTPEPTNGNKDPMDNAPE